MEIKKILTLIIICFALCLNSAQACNAYCAVSQLEGNLPLVVMLGDNSHNNHDNHNDCGCGCGEGNECQCPVHSPLNGKIKISDLPNLELPFVDSTDFVVIQDFVVLYENILHHKKQKPVANKNLERLRTVVLLN